VLLCDRQHAAGAACWVVDGEDLAAREETVFVGKEDVDHELDDLTWGEVLSGFLVGEVGRNADELLVDVAHLEVGDHVGVEVDLCELLDDHVENLGFGHLVDLIGQAEAHERVTGVRGEAADVGVDVAADVVLVSEERTERELRRVPERLAGKVAEHVGGGVPLVRSKLCGLGDDFVLCRFQHTVESSKDTERQDHVLVLVALVVVAKGLLHRPDERDLLPLLRAQPGRRRRNGDGGHDVSCFEIMDLSSRNRASPDAEPFQRLRKVECACGP
jgi:hypothetical protein